MTDQKSLEKEFLFYLISSTPYLGQIISSGFRPNFLDFDNPSFSPVRSLFEITCSFYSKYRKIVDRESLPTYLSNEKYTTDQMKLILLLFEEVLAVVPVLEFNFVMDLIKKNYAKALLHRKLTSGVDSLVANDIPRALQVMKEGIFTAENIFSSTAKEGTIQESVTARKHAYTDARGGKKVGLSTGFPTFDRLTGGLKGGELIILMSGSREGKSTALLNIAHTLQSRYNKNIFFVSAENPRAQLERRYDSLHTGLSYTKLRDGGLSLEEEQKYSLALEEIRNQPGKFYVWDQPLSKPQQIDAKLLELEPMIQFDAIFVDYLSLIQPDHTTSNAGKWEKVESVALSLREIARRRDIPVITAAQVNKEASKKQGQSYENTDVAFSYGLVYHADTILTMRVQDPEVLYSSIGIADIQATLTKCRDGSQGEFMISADFSIMKLTERTAIIT